MFQLAEIEWSGRGVRLNWEAVRYPSGSLGVWCSKLSRCGWMTADALKQRFGRPQFGKRYRGKVPVFLYVSATSVAE